MVMSRALWVPIAAATVLVGVLLSAPAFAQAHIRGTLTAAEDGTDRVLMLNYKGGEQTITIPTSATVVAFDKAPADQLAIGRKVFIVMNKDGSEAAAVVIGAEGVKPPM